MRWLNKEVLKEQELDREEDGDGKGYEEEKKYEETWQEVTKYYAEEEDEGKRY